MASGKAVSGCSNNASLCVVSFSRQMVSKKDGGQQRRAQIQCPHQLRWKEVHLTRVPTGTLALSGLDAD